MGSYRPHIVHVTDSLGVNGGAEQQLVANLRGFDHTRFRHSLVCLVFGPGMSRADLIPPNVDVQFLFHGTRPDRLTVIRHLDKAIDQLGADLLHCSVANASLATRIIGRRRKIPVVESLVNISHDPVRMVDNPNVRRWKLAAHGLVDRFTMRHVARYHALTTAVADSWVERIGIERSKVRVIPRGVDVEAFAAIDREVARTKLVEELDLDPETTIVLNVGRQVAQKGQRYAIQAMTRARAHVSADLVIAGSPGTQSQDLVDLVDAVGDGQVHLLGPRRDIAELMAAADVFVFPSLFEGLGVSLLEAMASGLAVVVSDIAPLNAIVEDPRTGLLVPAAGVQEIADAVVRLAHDTALRRSLGDSARDHVEQHYQIRRATAAVEGLYADVLDQ